MDQAIPLIVSAIQQGQPVEAERLCRISLARQPEQAEALLLLGMSLQQQGRMDEAVPYYSRLTELQPQVVEHWSNYATALAMVGDLTEAKEALKSALRLAPEDADLLDRLGTVQLQLREFLDARATLFKAFAIAPDSPVVRIHAAQACMACRDSRIGELVRPWRQWLPLDDDLQFTLAELQMQLTDGPAARDLLEDLVRRSPEHPGARLLLAGIYERTNQLEEADALLQEIEASPDAGADGMRKAIAYHKSRLALRRRNPVEARTILETSGPLSETDFRYYFALAEACDKSGDTAAAMRALEVAHKRQVDEIRAIAPYRFEPGAPIIPHAAARVSSEDLHGWPPLRAPDASQSPVFIVGFPRSGTTLLEQMLDAHPRLQSMDERPFFNNLSNQLEDQGWRVPQDLGKLEQRDCDELRKGYLTLACDKVRRRWDAQLVDKNPLNMLLLPIIHRLFPEAKFILALRHPCDVMLSCYMQNFQSMVLTVACASLENLAKAYVEAFQCWLYHVDVFKPQVFVSRYEELIADTPRQTARISEFLGLGDSESMLRFDERAIEKGYIATPSYAQVIQPINTKGLNRWHRYREYFEPVLPILRPMLEYWGYSTEAG